MSNVTKGENKDYLITEHKDSVEERDILSILKRAYDPKINPHLKKEMLILAKR